MQRIKKIENKEIQMSQSQWNYVIKEVFNDIIDEINTLSVIVTGSGSSSGGSSF